MFQRFKVFGYRKVGFGFSESFNNTEYLFPILITDPDHYLLQPVVMFAGEHCHPSFYSTGHGAFLTGRSAAQLAIRCAKEASSLPGAGLGLSNEVTYDLAEASVTDLSSWLSDLSTGDKKLEDYRLSQSGSRPRRDDGQYVTPR